MCSTIRYKQKNMGVGTHLISFGKNRNLDYKQWGIDNVYNARLDKLATYWKNFDRVYIECDSFYEGRALFEMSDISTLYLACVQNEQGILIVTKSSFNTIIQPYHPRLPVILLEPQLYVETGKIIEMNNLFLKLVA